MYGCIIKTVKIALKYVVVWSKHHKFGSFLEIFGYLWKSLVIFRHFCEMPANVCLALRNLFENLWQFSGSGWKSSENYQKHYVISMFNKQNNTCRLLAIRYGFSLNVCWSWFKYRSFLLPLVRYWVEHSKRNSISMCTNVLFSINLTNVSKLTPSLVKSKIVMVWYGPLIVILGNIF